MKLIKVVTVLGCTESYNGKNNDNTVSVSYSHGYNYPSITTGRESGRIYQGDSLMSPMSGTVTYYDIPVKSSINNFE